MLRLSEIAFLIIITFIVFLRVSAFMIGETTNNKHYSKLAFE